MYICPVCKRSFDKKDRITRHFLLCWKEHNPNHKSKLAPHSEDIVEREVSDAALNFFASLQNRG